MKKTLILHLVLVSFISAQTLKSAFTPGVYYTIGEYSNNISSKSLSFYGVVDIQSLDRIIIGYDNLSIDIPDSNWIYDQNFFVISGMKNLYPFYLKFDYGYASGKYGELIGNKYYYGSITDETHIIHASLLYNFDLFFVGLGGTYTTGSGYYNLSTNYVEGKLSWNPSNYFNVNLMHAYTTTDDDREAFSLGAELFYSPFPFINFSLRGFVGERVTYYNSDYQTFYNQLETQTNSYSIIARLFADKPFNIIGTHQSRDFTDYTIEYFTVGIKYSF